MDENCEVIVVWMSIVENFEFLYVIKIVFML